MAENNYNRRKLIKYPKPSETLAEFIGIFLGDGSFRNKYQTTISYNHRCENEYAIYIRTMILNLFGLESKLRLRKKYGSAEIVISSSNLVDYLVKTLGVLSIKQKHKMNLPK